MGSFAASLNVPERLRPWLQAGLSLVYLPEGLPRADAVQESAANATQPASVASAASTAPAPAVWPAPWSSVAARVRTPPRIILTYAELAEDLCGKADPARRKLLQNILGFLGWPQGTTLFWPLFHTSDDHPGEVFATDVFAAGVQHFAVKQVICFGDKAFQRAATLFPQEGERTTVRLHAAPSLPELLVLLPHELHRALAHLKDIPLP